MGLSLLSPWFLAGAAAVAVPIVLHLLARHTAPEVPFAATRFVPGAPVEQQRRRRPTDLLLLALRCLALLLLALGFARPYFTEATAGSALPLTVVALDVSFSMGGAETWTAAQSAARSAIDDAPPGGAVALVAFDTSARVLVPATLDRSAALAAVATARPGYGATSLRAIAAPAAEMLAGRPGRVVVVTDLQRSGVEGSLALPPAASLDVRAVQPARANASVDAMSRDGSAVVATVTNHGLLSREVTVTLSIDDRSVASRPVSLAPGSTSELRFDGMAAPKGIALVRVSDAGGLAADDERFLVLDEPRRWRVWVVGRGGGAEGDGFYLEAALASAASRYPFAVRTLQLPLEGLPAEAGSESRPDAIVLLATRGLGAEARRQIGQLVASGSGLLLAAGPAVEAGALAQLFGEAGGVVIEQAEAVPLPTGLAPVDVRHTVFAPYADRAAAYAGVRFDRVVRLRPSEGDRILANFENGLPAIAGRRVGQGRALMIASDLDARWNQWPASPTFVPFVAEAVAWVAGRDREPTQFLVGETPADVQPTPGAHVLRNGQRVVVNVDPRESSIDLASEADVRAMLTTAAALPPEIRAASRESTQALWWYVIVAVTVVLIVESLAGARRATSV
jgi:hypothetical protein